MNPTENNAPVHAQLESEYISSGVISLKHWLGLVLNGMMNAMLSSIKLTVRPMDR